MKDSTAESCKEEALQLFILRIKAKFLSSLTSLVDRSQAEDIFQETIYKIFLLAEQNPNKLTFIEKLEMMTPMLFKIAKNKAISDLRHCKVEQKYRDAGGAMDIELNTKTIESEIINDDDAQLLLEAINQLSPICRQVFVQRKLNGKSHAQIASMLNISTKTVESHIAKGLKQCRDYIVKKPLSTVVDSKRRVS